MREHIAQHRLVRGHSTLVEDEGPRVVAGLQRKAGAMDVIIAPTALAHDLTIWTQDSDFAVLHELQPALQIEGG